MRASVAVVALLCLGAVAGCLSKDNTQPAGPTPAVPQQAVGYAYTGLDANGYPVPRTLCRPMVAGEEKLHNGDHGGARRNFLLTPHAGRQGNQVTHAGHP